MAFLWTIELEHFSYSKVAMSQIKMAKGIPEEIEFCSKLLSDLISLQLHNLSSRVLLCPV